MKIVLIAAIGKNNELGKNNGLIWNIPGDLKFFKDKTLNHPIVMGYNTFLSIGKVLPKRDNIILTHKSINIPNAIMCHTKKELLDKLKSYNDEIFIIGGSTMYKEFIDVCDKLLLTEIEETDKDADVYFPVFNKTLFNKKIINECVENNIKYKHVEYVRIKK